jgi:hypothetical protein
MGGRWTKTRPQYQVREEGEEREKEERNRRGRIFTIVNRGGGEEVKKGGRGEVERKEKEKKQEEGS